MNKLMNKVRKNKKGFTLIELIVVIVILGILVLLAAPRFLNYTKDADVATMQADAKVLSNAALIYNIEHEGNWPVEVKVVDEETGEKTEVEARTKTINGKEVKVQNLNKDAFKDQTLKNDIKDYVMVSEGTTIEVSTDEKVDDVKLQEGDILYLKGVEDRAGDMHYGVNLEIKKADIVE